MTSGRSIYIRPWRVDVTIRPGAVPRPVGLSIASLVRHVAAALGAAGAPAPASIGLTLSHDAELAELNATHLGIDGPTDVLSFPLLDPVAFPPHPGGSAATPRPGGRGFVLPPGRRPHLGDIVISVERAVAQAREGRGGQTGDIAWSAADELRLLAIHGTLHVCGWDHAEREEREAMRALERRLMGVSPAAT